MRYLLINYCFESVTAQQAVAELCKFIIISFTARGPQENLTALEIFLHNCTPNGMVRRSGGNGHFTREAIHMDWTEDTLDAFGDGFGCSQALVSVYGQKFGLDRKTALKISAAFSCGLGRMGLTCGAVTGALMIIGLKHGRTLRFDILSREKTDALAKKFILQFTARHGSTQCKDLLGCDLSTPEGLKIAGKEELIPLRCPQFVESACEILEGLLNF